jgi:hypothetical protein
MNQTDPQYPIFIPSKGRWKSRLTSKWWDSLGIPYRLVVEPDEYDNYLNEVGDEKKLIKLDMSYKEKYDLCDDLGQSKTTGSGPARNFIWDTAEKEGHKWHWIMDDNIMGFRRMHKNRKIRVANGAPLRIIEDFCARYENVAMAGPHYDYFFPSRVTKPPITVNSRIYSCNLIRTDVPFRWRGRYNEDTILSLDMLKKGWCTVLFNALLQDKVTTQVMKGGNTDQLYKDGTLAKSQMMVDTHGDVCKLSFKYKRWHHHCDYKPFMKKNKLVRKKDWKPKGEPNNYGMQLKIKK